MEWVKSGDEPYMQMERLSLRNYYPHEIERLSVIRVNQTKTFDDVGYSFVFRVYLFQVGHPIRGGLYDPQMGPFSHQDRCETCNQYDIHCPGHLGHIELDVPVFNPVLFSFTLNVRLRMIVLNSSCSYSKDLAFIVIVLHVTRALLPAKYFKHNCVALNLVSLILLVIWKLSFGNIMVITTTVSPLLTLFLMHI